MQKKNVELFFRIHSLCRGTAYIKNLKIFQGVSRMLTGQISQLACSDPHIKKATLSEKRNLKTAILISKWLL